MSTLLSPPPPPKPFGLFKLATIFAVVFAISFGLCTVGTMSGDKLGFLIPLSLVTEAVCLIGLLVVGIIAIVRSFMK